MQIRYILIIIGYVFLASYAFYYKSQNVVLNSRLEEIKMQSQIKEEMLKAAVKENEVLEKVKDRKIKDIKSAKTPSDCPALIDWMVQQMKS